MSLADAANSSGDDVTTWRVACQSTKMILQPQLVELEIRETLTAAASIANS